ncbi:SapC family protein [Ruegeria sp. SCP11]|uniref:SapC family protein n=1 Tax=Ruegeria sp. SCP11 TaxID=3141378 RepID=UPI003339E69B
MAQNGLVPVTVARHGHRFWKRFTSYSFAATRTDCAVVLQELPQAAAAFPIVFKNTNQGIEPRAILSLSDSSSTPFVSPDGLWLASYVPSDLRCYPFQAEFISNETADQTPLFRLSVDEASGLISNNPRDEAFFSHNGTLSSALDDVRSFLQAREASKQATLELCRQIEALGLFEPMSSHNGIALPQGTLGVSTLRTKNLPVSEKLKLLESGSFFLVHAHHISLSHCEWLNRVQQQIVQANYLEKYTKNSDVSGFLCAMANARNDEILGISGV